MNANLRAVLTGASIDIGGSTFFGGVASVLFIAVLSANGASQQQLYTVLYSSTSFLLALSFLGLLFNALGGYVAARLAGQRHILIGAASAGPCLFLSLLGLLNPLPNYYPIWVIVVGWLFCVPSGAFGGYLASRQA